MSAGGSALFAGLGGGARGVISVDAVAVVHGGDETGLIAPLIRLGGVRGMVDEQNVEACKLRPLTLALTIPP